MREQEKEVNAVVRTQYQQKKKQEEQQAMKELEVLPLNLNFKTEFESKKTLELQHMNDRFIRAQSIIGSGHNAAEEWNEKKVYYSYLG